MEIVNLSDVHLMTRRNIKKVDDVTMERFFRLVDGLSPSTVVTVAGDLFDVPILHSSKNYQYLYRLIEIMRRAHDSKGVSFLILRANHDYLQELDSMEGVGMLSIMEALVVNGNMVVNQVSELPAILIAGSITYVDVLDEDTRICLLPYNYDRNEVIKKGNFQNRVLICHGCVGMENDPKYPNVISENIVNKFTHVFKGHIHKRYHDKNLISNGSMVKLFSDDQEGWGYLNTNTGNFEIRDFDDGLTLQYVSGVYQDEEINQVLESLTPFSIASLYLKGDPKKMDAELFQRRYQECMDLKMVFESSFVNRVSQSDEGDGFITLDQYLKQNLDEETWKYMQSLQKEA